MRPRLLCLLLGVLICACGTAAAGTPPAGFQETAYVPSLFQVDSFEWAPNGDMWIISKVGLVRVLRAGSTTPIIVRNLAVDPNGERGLLGLALDPAFDTNHFLYLYYTVPTTPVHNRVSRFTSVGDTLQNETILLEGPELISLEHQSGNLAFGLDGLLYISMGDNRQPALAQDRGSLLGKILRIAPNGTVPPGNPFVGDPNARPEVWAYGFRNPWRFSVQPVTGNIFIGDVGEATWEELDLGISGADYGHPLVEGPEPAGVAGMTYPIYWYNHNGSGAAIIAGDFMRGANFPPEYATNFFFADSAQRKLLRMVLDASNQPVSVADFVTNAVSPVHVRVGPDGALYYASIQFSTIYRVGYVGGTNRQPVAVSSATPDNGLAPLAVQFDATGSFDPDGTPLTYAWSFGDGGTASGPSPMHTYATTGVFSARLDASDGQATGSTTRTIVSGNRAPTATILSPADGSFFNAGDTIPFDGAATDPEEGSLGAGAFSWTVLFHHNIHVHPYLGPLSGITSGSFMAEDVGETSSNVWYEILLTASDSGVPLGTAATLSDTRSVSIFPNLSTMTFTTAPRGDLGLTLDGAPFTAPRAVVGVVGLKRVIEAVSPQSPGDGRTYTFAQWSDGGARLHTIATPPADTTFTATFTCNVLSEVQDLEVSLAPSGDVALSWTPPADICLASGSAVYRVYRSSTPVPSVPPGMFPTDPAFALAASTGTASASFTPGPGDEFYLVVPLGTDGSEGPVGHYGK